MPKTETVTVDRKATTLAIALHMTALAELFAQLANGTADREITDVGITAAEVAKAKGEAPATDPPKAKPGRPAKAKPAEPPPEEPEASDLTPEQLKADAMAKLTALVGKDRAKAKAILGTFGAGKFSEVPVEKHGELVRLFDAALNPPKPADDDPLG